MTLRGKIDCCFGLDSWIRNIVRETVKIVISWNMIVASTLITMPLSAQQDKHAQSIVERFFIVESRESNERGGSQATIFFDSDSQAKVGEVFYLISHPRKLIKARLTRILAKEERPNFGAGPKPAGVLEWDPALKFTFHSEIAAIRAPKPSLDSIGVIRSIDTRAYNEKAKVKGRERLNDWEIEFPGQKKACHLISEEWWDNPASIGDLNNMAGQESRFDCFGKVIVKKCLMEFLSVTSLEKHGVYEIVESCGGSYTSTFELIRYDGKKLGEPLRILFETMD